MHAEFINRPISGQYPEKHFGQIAPNCLWVKFVDNDKQEWVGSFEQSWIERGIFIINLTNKGKAFIVSGGLTFLIDINTQEQLNKTKISDTKTAIVDGQEENIYYSNGFDLRYIDIKGNDFVLFDNYYFDDIKLVEIKENKLYATYWSYQTRNEPFRFEIDTVTKEVKDSFYNTETKSYSYVNPKPTFLAKLTKWLTK